jgi:hypothetical protein
MQRSEVMKLTDLEPRWYETTPGNRVGFTFECPHCAGSGSRLAVATHLDGTNMDPDPANLQQFATGETVWDVTSGSSFADISLSPSVDASRHGHWHGFITNGEIAGGI